MTDWTNQTPWGSLNGLRADVEYTYEPADCEVGIMSDDYIIERVCVLGIDIAGLLSENTMDKLQAELRDHVESLRRIAQYDEGEERGIRIAEWHAMALNNGE